MEQKIFQVKFVMDKTNNIQTQITSKGITPTEAIGLLEMAKDQMMENIRQGRKNIFDVKGDL